MTINYKHYDLYDKPLDWKKFFARNTCTFDSIPLNLNALKHAPKRSNCKVLSSVLSYDVLVKNRESGLKIGFAEKPL